MTGHARKVLEAHRNLAFALAQVRVARITGESARHLAALEAHAFHCQGRLNTARLAHKGLVTSR